MEFSSGQVGTTFITLLCKQGGEGTEGCPCGGGSPAMGRGWDGGRAALEGAGEKEKRAWLRPAPRSNFKVNCPADFCIFWAEMRVL